MNKPLLVLLLIGFSLGAVIPAQRDAAVQRIAAAQRIISIAPSITEEIFQLGAGDRLAGVTTYCLYPAEARKKPKIGNILDFNLEVIASLKPDIVIGTSINEQSKTGRLRDLGIRVRLIPEGSSFREMCSNLVVLGGLIGREAEATGLVKTYRQKLAAVSRKTARPESVLFVVGTEPLIAAGAGSFISEIIGRAGFRNAVRERKAYLRYSMEMVVKEDPAVIVISAPAPAAKKEIKAWKRHTGLKAVRSGRIYAVDPDLFGLAVPSRFVKAVERLSKTVK